MGTSLHTLGLESSLKGHVDSSLLCVGTNENTSFDDVTKLKILEWKSVVQGES